MSQPPLRLRITPPIGESFEHYCDGDTLVVGRSSKADLVLSDRFLSRLHARFFLEGETWFIEDLGSRNTTLLNGRPVATPMHLAPGDLVKLSETVLSIEGFDEAATRPKTASADDAASSDSMLLRSASELLAAAERESGDRMRVLNEVHRVLAAPISLEKLLELILDRAFAHLRPEEGALFLKTPLGELERAASRRLPGATGDFLVSRSLEREVSEKGQAALVLDAQTDARFAAAESILSAGVRSLVAAPLLGQDANLGMIVLSSRVHMRRYSEEDLELLAALASVAALRIQNLSLTEEAARRQALEREMNIARQIQIALLPESLPEVEGYSLFATNDASRAVSGDFYEVQTSEETGEQVIVIADVSGKGMSASLVAASLDALLMGPIEVGHPTDKICTRVGRRLHARTPPERYATAILASLDSKTGVLSYTNAGHNPGLLVRAKGSSELLEGQGMPLGLFPFAEYERAEVTLSPGDLVVLYTDGITEAANAEGEEFGLDRLEKVVKEQAKEPLVAIAVAIETAVEVFAEERRFADDRTVVILRREPD